MMNRYLGPRGMTIGALAAVSVLLAVLLEERGAAGSLLPHGYCFTWNPTLLWTHVASDSLIGVAYISIPITLLHLVRKREDLPFNWIVVLFALFIVSCGATHWIEVWTVWHPDYWLSGNVKVITAVASVLTAAALVRLVPSILAIPTVEQLKKANAALEAEIVSRRAAEDALRRERAELERRVIARTEDLALATQSAEAAHAQAQEANRLKDRFLAKVSHELRTPLQSTMGWANVLKKSAGDPARSMQAADRIIHNVRSQARLIDDLLDISRILSGKLGLELRRVDAVAVIEQAAEVVRTASAARAVAIEVTGGPSELPLDTDAVRLEQVIWNLINNAVQASPDGGHVQVRHESTPTHWVVQVQDWGRGIDVADLPHIFEPFRRGPQDPNDHRGLGLGLAITRSIVELFGGELEAKSDGPGHGATFVLRLPLPSEGVRPAEVEERELSAAERARLAGVRVLYVEDEPDIAESGRQMLVELGARVELCQTFDTARERVVEGGFDVLLSDLNLGDGHTALELIALLRSAPRGREIPAVVLSAYGGDEDRKVSADSGFARHLVKPTGPIELARALIDVLTGRGGH